MIVFKPKSFMFIFFISLINLLSIGILVFAIISMFRQNWICTLVGIAGFCLLILENINLLKHKITFTEDSIQISTNYYQKILNKTNNIIVVKFLDIEKIEFEKIPSQIITIKVLNSKKLLYIYLKQYNKTQINSIINLLNEKIKKLKK